MRLGDKAAQDRRPRGHRGHRPVLHPRQRQGRRARRGRLQHRLRRPQRRLHRLRPRGRAAHRRVADASATSPRTRSRRPTSEAELRVFEQQAADKPENVRAKIAEGKLRKWMEEVVLLKQQHVNADKHDGKTIEQLRAELSRHDRRERRHPPLRALRGRGLAIAGAAPAFERILLKLSGEALMGELEYGTDPDARRGDRRADQGRARPRRRGRGRARRRQHLPRHEGAPRRAWTARPATTWACSRRCSTR